MKKFDMQLVLIYVIPLVVMVGAVTFNLNCHTESKISIFGHTYSMQHTGFLYKESK